MLLTFGRRTEEAVITYHPLSMALRCAAGLQSAYVTLPLACLLCGKKEDFEYFAPNILPYFVDKANVECGIIFEGE